ncbi:MAG: hypothetical protein ACRYFW_01665 [Janthinobacterium lividum]
MIELRRRGVQPEGVQHRQRPFEVIDRLPDEGVIITMNHRDTHVAPGHHPASAQRKPPSCRKRK